MKHTPEDHPDHGHLLDAQKNIKRLAERINKGRRNAEEVERETRVMQEIEAHIEGVEHVRHISQISYGFLSCGVMIHSDNEIVYSIKVIVWPKNNIQLNLNVVHQPRLVLRRNYVINVVNKY